MAVASHRVVVAAALHDAAAAFAVEAHLAHQGRPAEGADADAACEVVAFAYAVVDRAYVALGACQVQVGKALVVGDLLGRVVACHLDVRRHHEVDVRQKAFVEGPCLDEEGPSCLEEACLCPCPCLLQEEAAEETERECERDDGDGSREMYLGIWERKKHANIKYERKS